MQKAARFNWIPSPLALGLLLLPVYLATLAPGLTWANHGSDGGDLITAAAVGGVPHPTGYPTYLLLARLFQFLPIGSLAYRTNLMSAIFTTLAAILLCDCVRRIRITSDLNSEAGGWITGLAFGLAPLVWSQAVITEVYALQGFWIALILWRLAISPKGRRADLFFGLLIGLGLGIHLTILLLIPAFMLARAFRPEGGRDWRPAGVSFQWQLIGFGIGLLVYTALPLRAWQHPAVNWGDVGTPGRFWWLVSGQLYHDSLSLLPAFDIWQQIRFTAALLLDQAGLIGLVLAALGLVWFFRPSRWVLLTIWMFAASTTFAILYQTEDSYIYLIPAIVSFTVWLGWGSAILSKQVSNYWQPAGRILSALSAIYLLGLAAGHRPQVNASYDDRAENFASEALVSLPRNAIVLARGDEAVFTLWYEVFALKQRTDLAVLSEDLLPFDWYRQSLRVTYPGLVVQDQPDNVWAVVLERENGSRPLCHVSAEESTMIDCRQTGSIHPEFY